jgi:hypothetical protein
MGAMKRQDRNDSDGLSFDPVLKRVNPLCCEWIFL